MGSRFRGERERERERSLGLEKACVWIGHFAQSVRLCFFNGSRRYYLRTHKSQQNTDFWVNLGLTVLFTPLKIIFVQHRGT